MNILVNCVFEIGYGFASFFMINISQIGLSPEAGDKRYYKSLCDISILLNIAGPYSLRLIDAYLGLKSIQVLYYTTGLY